MADIGGEETSGIETLKNFERALGHVRNSVRPLTLMSREEVGACVSPADRAKLNLQMAYGVTSLFYMFLKTQGVSPSNHPVKAELDRIKGYFGRLQKVGKPPEERKLKIDAEASRRFINSALSGDNVWRDAQARNGSNSLPGSSAGAGIGRSNPAGQPVNNSAQDGDKFVFVGIPLGTGRKKRGLLSGRAKDDNGDADDDDSSKKATNKKSKHNVSRSHKK